MWAQPCPRSTAAHAEQQAGAPVAAQADGLAALLCGLQVRPQVRPQLPGHVCHACIGTSAPQLLALETRCRRRQPVKSRRERPSCWCAHPMRQHQNVLRRDFSAPACASSWEPAPPPSASAVGQQRAMSRHSGHSSTSPDRQTTPRSMITRSGAACAPGLRSNNSQPRLSQQLMLMRDASHDLYWPATDGLCAHANARRKPSTMMRPATDGLCAHCTCMEATFRSGHCTARKARLSLPRPGPAPAPAAPKLAAGAAPGSLWVPPLPGAPFTV